MDAVPPRIDEAKPANRLRWGIHLGLITAYILLLTLIGLMRNRTGHPALTGSASGLLKVCAVELLSFGCIFALAWLVSRASVDDLLLRWRGKVMPVLLGAAYSVALRLGVLVAAVMAAIILVLTHVVTPDSLSEFAARNRPGVENAVDLAAMRDNPAYFALTLTVVSFVVAGLREELWRSSFLAGMRALWPRQFGSTLGQFWAVTIGAVIFGAAHLSMGVLAAAMAGLLGLGLGVIMILHRSIWPAVIAHGFFDATSMALIPWAMELMKQMPKH